MTNDRPNRQRPKPFEKVNPKKKTVISNEYGHQNLPGSLDNGGGTGVSERPHFDYDYYDENDDQFIGKIRAQVSGVEWSLHRKGKWKDVVNQNNITLFVQVGDAPRLTTLIINLCSCFCLFLPFLLLSIQVKVILHGNGNIECLDQGNFPHPLQCKKFISCAKVDAGGLIGWEYTCPRGLSYDPVGGICNWAAGLGCKEN